MKLPSHFNEWNPSMRGAFRKGMESRLAEDSINNCPYKDKRNESGRLTWSRAYISAWEDGWRYADADREQALITQRFIKSFSRTR